MEEAKTAKDDLYIEAKEEFDVTLDRRKTLEEMQDQVDRLRKNGKSRKRFCPQEFPKRFATSLLVLSGRTAKVSQKTLTSK